MVTVPRVARALGAACIALVVLPAAVLAAPPEHAREEIVPLDLPAGTVCVDAVRFEDTTLRAMDTLFAPGPTGTQRFTGRGSGVSVMTNTDTGATYAWQGGFRITTTIYADGSIRADASGTDFIAYYFPGDPSEIGSGVFRVTGHLTEWYAADGTYLGNRVTGTAVDLCAALGTAAAQ
jgi:hypothetical protein